jgi:hypothetical protein
VGEAQGGLELDRSAWARVSRSNCWVVFRALAARASASAVFASISAASYWLSCRSWSCDATSWVGGCDTGSSWLFAVIVRRIVIWASDARMSPYRTFLKSSSISRPRLRSVNDCTGEFEVLELFTKANIGCTVGALVETNISLS